MLLSSLKPHRTFFSRQGINLASRGLSANAEYIVKSPVDLPELKSGLVKTPLPVFIMKDFLSKDRKDLVASVDGTTGASLTFDQSYHVTHSLATNLRDKLGIAKNDTVAIMSPNHLYYFPSFMSISLLGAVSSCINPLYSETEILHQIKEANAKAIFVHPMCVEKVLKVKETNPQLKDMNVILMDQGLPDHHPVLHHSHLAEHHIHRLTQLYSASTPAIGHKYDFFKEIQTSSFDPEAVATIPFSSGTTGKSKGVILSHRNLVSNVLQTLPFEGVHLLPNPAKNRDRGTMLVPLPFFHIYGLTVGLLVAHYLGAQLVFMPAFDLPKYLEIIQKYKVTRAFVVPPIVLALAKHPIVDSYDLSSLDCLISGAAPLGFDIQVAAAKRLKCMVKQAWGMTETSPVAAISDEKSIGSVEDLNGTSGPLVPGTEAKLVHPATGADIPSNEEGELLVRGPQIMMGYLNNPEANAKTIRPDGWMHTGDIATFDHRGWLYIRDRIKELIKYKGFQVPPAELEALILTMPEVKDVIVIPVPDDEAGEVPRAYVVKQDNCPKDFSADDIIEFVHANVAPHKRLRGGVIFAPSVPKSPSGKLLRRVQIELDREVHKQSNLHK